MRIYCSVKDIVVTFIKGLVLTLATMLPIMLCINKAFAAERTDAGEREKVYAVLEENDINFDDDSVYHDDELTFIIKTDTEDVKFFVAEEDMKEAEDVLRANGYTVYGVLGTSAGSSYAPTSTNTVAAHRVPTNMRLATTHVNRIEMTTI